jgi:hypothetical protein
MRSPYEHSTANTLGVYVKLEWRLSCLRGNFDISKALTPQTVINATDSGPCNQFLIDVTSGM